MVQKSDHRAKEMRTIVFQHMLSTRGWKYRTFLRYLRLFKYLAFAPVRGEFLESYYTLMRYLDDIVDGDLPLPENYKTAANYISAKIEFSRHLLNPEDEADHLLVYCFDLAKKFGENFQNETKDILESLLFDANRRSTFAVFSEEELNHHFHLLDIRGTIKATLKIFKDDPEKYHLLEPLGTACRFEYDIEDIDTDLAAGYVNISAEDCDRFNILPEDFKNSSSLKIQKWLCHHARQGLDLLELHFKNLAYGNFTMFERLAFRLVYEKPARYCFCECLKRSTDTNKLK